MGGKSFALSACRAWRDAETICLANEEKKNVNEDEKFKEINMNDTLKLAPVAETIRSAHIFLIFLFSSSFAHIGSVVHMISDKRSERNRKIPEQWVFCLARQKFF